MCFPLLYTLFRKFCKASFQPCFVIPLSVKSYWAQHEFKPPFHTVNIGHELVHVCVFMSQTKVFTSWEHCWLYVGMLQSASASQLSAARFHFAGSSTFWPREAHMGGRFGHNVVKANKPVSLSLQFCGRVPSQEPKTYSIHTTWRCKLDFYVSQNIFLDGKDKRMSPYWPWRCSFHEMWHDQKSVIADLWHTRTSQLALLPRPPPHTPSFHPFFILPMGLHIFSPSWYVSCELSRKFRKFLRCWTEDKLRFVLSFLEILQLHFSLPEDPVLLLFCASGDITNRFFLDSLVIFSSYDLFFCHV